MGREWRMLSWEGLIGEATDAIDDTKEDEVDTEGPRETTGLPLSGQPAVADATVRLLSRGSAARRVPCSVSKPLPRITI